MISFDLTPESLADALRRIEACIAEIQDWMTSNFLKLDGERLSLCQLF